MVAVCSSWIRLLSLVCGRGTICDGGEEVAGGIYRHKVILDDVNGGWQQAARFAWAVVDGTWLTPIKHARGNVNAVSERRLQASL